MAAQHDPDWLGSRKVGTKKKDPTVEVEGASYEFAVEVASTTTCPMELMQSRISLLRMRSILARRRSSFHRLAPRTTMS